MKSALLSNNNALWHLIQNLLKYMQLCIEYSHLCKLHHLECINIPEIVNNSMQLGVSFLFHFKMFCSSQQLSYLVIQNEREHDLGASKQVSLLTSTDM